MFGGRHRFENQLWHRTCKLIQDIHGFTQTLKIILDFKLSPYSECCVQSFGLFPDVWSLIADVSEQCLDHVRRWNRHRGPNRRLLNTTRRGTTLKINSVNSNKYKLRPLPPTSCKWRSAKCGKVKEIKSGWDVKCIHIRVVTWSEL
jgi:hypothetical protein